MPYCAATNRHGAACRRLVHSTGERCSYHLDLLSAPLPREYWFCSATNRSGRPCRRLVPSSGALCAYHRADVAPVTPAVTHEAGPHSTDHLSPAEREAIAQALLLPEPSSEIAVVRILIRHAATRGYLDLAFRGMATLGHLLKVNKALDPAGIREENRLSQPLAAWAEILLADDDDFPAPTPGPTSRPGPESPRALDAVTQDSFRLKQ